MKLNWSFFQNGDSIPLSNLRKVKTSTSSLKSVLLFEESKPAETASVVSVSTLESAHSTLESAHSTLESAHSTLDLDTVPAPVETVAFSGTMICPDSPFGGFDSKQEFEDWDLDSFSLSGDNLTEVKAGSLFVFEFCAFEDCFSKVHALGFTHEHAFPIVPLLDGESMCLRVEAAFNFLSTFNSPKIIDVRIFEKHDSWKISIILSCLIHCFLRELFENSTFQNWLSPTFDKVDTRKICVNKLLLSDAKEFAVLLFDEFCAVVNSNN
jgi:hypothetical protein